MANRVGNLSQLKKKQQKKKKWQLCYPNLTEYILSLRTYLLKEIHLHYENMPIQIY